MPRSAHASIFSFVKNNLLGFGSQETASETVTSQNVALLQAVLNSNSNLSRGGGEITIVGDALYPDAGPEGTVADVLNTAPSSDQISLYVVREGDSLSQIAKMFKVSVNTIIWANDIERGGLIREGQTLVILPLSGVRHTVAKGDTLSSIAKKYRADVEEIKDFNGISGSSELVLGQVVLVPDGEIGTVATPNGVQTRTPLRGAGGPALSDYFLRPVFGSRTQGLHGYNGVDLSASYGAPVVASAAGVVIISREYGWNGGYGQYIVISHPNGTQTLYAHLGANIVSPGASVVRGQVIGYAGSTGKSTGPHLHFEVRGAAQPF